MVPVQAIKVRDVDEEPRVPGAFEFYERDGRIAGMLYVCPCGCGRKGSLPFRPDPSASATWEFDGKQDKPTLRPSIHHKIAGNTHWHGWLIAGQWSPC